jgi:hypothetical protein
LKLITTYIMLLALLGVQVPAAAQEKAFRKSGKAPMGLYVFNDQLKEFYPFADVKTISNTIYNSLKGKSFERSLYLVTYRGFSPVWQDLTALKDFAEEGNQVMIFATCFNKEARDFFNFTTVESGFGASLSDDSIRLKDAVTGNTDYFKASRFDLSPSFILYDSSKITVLGVNGAGRPDFIKVKEGRGAIYVHLLPEVITNYFLLHNKNAAYTQGVLSYVPRNMGTILWKFPRPGGGGGGGAGSEYDGEKSSEFGFLSFLWNDADLKNALLLALLLFALLIIFGFKRRQRIIPVLTPVENTTLEFARTMGDLYFNNRNNTAIAAKKMQYWQEYVRNTYNIPTRNMDAGFWELLIRKTGFEPAFLKQLEIQMVKARNEPSLKDRDLIQLNNSIDQFYKK